MSFKPQFLYKSAIADNTFGQSMPKELEPVGNHFLKNKQVSWLEFK